MRELGMITSPQHGLRPGRIVYVLTRTPATWIVATMSDPAEVHALPAEAVRLVAQVDDERDPAPF